MSFLHGLLAGLAMIIFIGPVLFTLLQAALSYGYRGGLAVATGIIVSDVIAIFICKMGASTFFLEDGNRIWIAMLGGAILLGLAYRYIFRPQFFKEGEIELGVQDLSGLFGKGFLVNFVNPFVFVVWIGIIGYGEGRFFDQIWVYLAGVLIGIFITDNLKAFYASKLKRFLSADRLKSIYTVTGTLLILFAVRLFYLAYTLS